MAEVTYDNATCIYPGAERPAVDGLELGIRDGEFVVMVGPSGCGKTTALRMLAGLEEIDGGAVRIDGRDMTGVPSRDRDIAMVFQNYALYPSKTVAENMGFALKMQGVAKDERARRVGEAAKLLDLEQLLDRKPRNLSGGQRQRVAMGRPQDQQRDRPGPARQAHGQAAHHRRNRRRPARRRHRHHLRALRPRMRGLHGRRGRQAPGPERLPHEAAGRDRGAGGVGLARP